VAGTGVAQPFGLVRRACDRDASGTVT